MTKVLPIFHIGANKAGSTTLQQALFAHHPEVHNLGKPDPIREAALAIRAVRDSCDSTIGSPEFELEKVRRLWENAVRRPEGKGRVPVFSREVLILNRYYSGPDPTQLPRAIKAMAGPCRMVVVVRNQLRLLESRYIHKANTTDYQPVEKWLKDDEQTFGYNFHNIADAWAQVLGEENVGVFLFEELASDGESFARKLCNFIGIEPETGVQLMSERHENARKSHRTQSYARLRSLLFPNASFGGLLPARLRREWRSFLEGGPGEQVEFPAHWLDRMKEHYRADNRKLAKRFQLPLRDFGYPL